MPRRGYSTGAEQAKISLSTAESAPVFVPNYLVSDDESADIDVTVTRADLEQLTAEIVQKGMGSIDQLLDGAHETDASLSSFLQRRGW